MDGRARAILVEHLLFALRNFPTHQSSYGVSLSVRAEEIHPVVVFGQNGSRVSNVPEKNRLATKNGERKRTKGPTKRQEGQVQAQTLEAASRRRSKLRTGPQKEGVASTVKTCGSPRRTSMGKKAP